MTFRERQAASPLKPLSLQSFKASVVSEKGNSASRQASPQSRTKLLASTAQQGGASRGGSTGGGGMSDTHEVFPRFERSLSIKSKRQAEIEGRIASLRPRIHTITPIHLPEMTRHTRAASSAAVAPMDYHSVDGGGGGRGEGGGGDIEHLLVGASDGFRFFSNGTRWHIWGFAAVTNHTAWAVDIPPPSADEPKDFEDKPLDVVMTCCVPLQETTGRVLVCTGNSQGWIHIWDMSKIHKPKYWQDQMLSSAFDAVSGEVHLANVSSDITILMRWQIYSDGPVAGVKMVTQMVGVPCQLLLSHAGTEEQARCTERLRYQRRTETLALQAVRTGLDLATPHDTLHAISCSQGGSALWELDGNLAGCLASLAGRGRENRGGRVAGQGKRGGGSAMEEGRGEGGGEGDDIFGGWSAASILSNLYGIARASTAMAQHTAAMAAAQAAPPSYDNLKSAARAVIPITISRVASSALAAKRNAQGPPVTSHVCAKATVAMIDRAAQQYERQLAEYASETQKQGAILQDAVAEFVENAGQESASHGHGHGHGHPCSSSAEDIRLWKERPGAFFVIDSRRKTLKKVDDEMEAFRFFSRSPSSIAPALDMLTHQRTLASNVDVSRSNGRGGVGVGSLASAAGGAVAQELNYLLHAAKEGAAGGESFSKVSARSNFLYKDY